MRGLLRQIWNTKGLARWILLVGAIVTVIFVLFALFAPWIAPFDFNQTRDAGGVKFEKLASSGGGHLLGTNDQFYDIVSRVVWGARTALEVVLLSVVLSVVIGVPTSGPSPVIMLTTPFGTPASVRTLTKFRERREVIAVDIVEREREDPEPGVAFLACGNGLPLVVLDAGCNPTGTRRR